MILPNKVIVYGITYKVKYYKRLRGVHKGRKQYGRISYAKREIRIHKGNRKKSEVLTILMHEILHALTTGTKMNLSEGDITELAFMLTDTLVRNKFIIL